MIHSRGDESQEVLKVEPSGLLRNWIGDKRDMKDGSLEKLDDVGVIYWERLRKEQVWGLGEAFRMCFLCVEFDMAIDIQVNMLS